MSDDKKEYTMKGYRVVVDDGSHIDEFKSFLLASIESYSALRNKTIKIVFFNSGEDGEESGVTFFFNKDN